jgi:hypothetical protein
MTTDDYGFTGYLFDHVLGGKLAVSYPSVVKGYSRMLFREKDPIIWRVSVEDPRVSEHVLIYYLNFVGRVFGLIMLALSEYDMKERFKQYYV